MRRGRLGLGMMGGEEKKHVPVTMATCPSKRRVSAIFNSWLLVCGVCVCVEMEGV